MAKMDFSLPADLMQKFEKLQGNQLDQICERALESAGTIVLKETKSQLLGAIGKNLQSERDKVFGSRSTGELVASLGESPVMMSRDGTFNVKIGFSEPRRHNSGGKEKTNAMIANVLEHGRHGQQPRPFMSKARNKSKKAAIEEVARVFTEGIESL